MKDYWFKIKVSDLLLNPWKSDIISFEKKYINIENELKDCEIQWTVEIQSLDHKTIWVTIKTLNTSIKKICEICWKDYILKVVVTEYFTKFVTPEVHTNPWEKIHDEEFLIEQKDESIDLQDMICQSILVQYPLVFKCEDCVKINVENENEEELEINYDFESTNTIKWIK